MKATTPWHLWLVGAISAAWNGFGCFDFTMTATHNAAYLKAYPQEMLDYLFNMPAWTWIVWAIGVFGGLLGAIALLMKSRFAAPLYLMSFLAAATSMVQGSFDKNGPKMEGMEMFPYIVLGIAVVQLGYTVWLGRKGVLA